MIKKIILKIPFAKFAYNQYLNIKLFIKIKKAHFHKQNCVFVMATPTHGNLGDHAIVHAEKQLLSDNGYSGRIIEISNDDYIRAKNIIKHCVKQDDLVIIDGGGNLGTLWKHEDDKISQIINSYRKNRIVVFPQTCYYSDDEESLLRLRKNYDIYKSAKKLTVALRDKRSYDFFCTNFKGINTLYTPDIVLYINNLSFESARNGCLLCFRKDLEKAISDSELDKIKNHLISLEISYKETSTVIKKRVTEANREHELYEKWNEFSKAEFVITDRLHAMIFCAITGTPCIAVDNISKKVSGVGQWISDLPYIKICKNIDEIKNLIKNQSKDKHEYKRNGKLFEGLERII